MKFKRHLKLEHGPSQLDIIPLVNVIFIVLIFFMLTSSFTAQSGIKVNWPKAMTSEIIKNDSLIITITSENVTILNDQIVSIKDLRQELEKQAIKRRSIIIKSDRRASLGRIIEVWDLCRDLGIDKVNIATDQEK